MGWRRGPILGDEAIIYDPLWNIPINCHALAGFGWLVAISINGYLGTQFAEGNFVHLNFHRRLGQFAIGVLCPFLCATAFFNETHPITEADTSFTRTIQTLTVINTLLQVILGYVRRKNLTLHMQHMYAAINSAGSAATVRIVMDLCVVQMTPACAVMATDPSDLAKFQP
jgi:hypothetical protein